MADSHSRRIYSHRRSKMAGGNIKEFNEENFQVEVLDSPLPVLVDFTAEWCGPCKMIAPAIEEVADGLAGKVKVGKLNTDNSPGIAGKYGIMSIPTLLVIHEGQVKAQKVGLCSKDDILNMIEDAVGVS
jgi:thioredoxin 1